MDTETLIARLRAVGCVFAEDEARLLQDAAGDTAVLEGLLARRLRGEPLEHVLGWVDLAGERLAVGPGAFVPRQRSTVVIATSLAALPPNGGIAVELCCGVAAIGAVIARTRPDMQVWATDLDPVPLRYARRNLDPSHVLEGDLFDPLPRSLRGTVDVVVANAPYVPTAELSMMPAEARDHEPRLALDGGADGLDLHRRIAAEVRGWLRPGGAVVIETSRSQASRTVAALADGGLQVTVRHDAERDGTAVIGHNPHGQTSPPATVGDSGDLS